MTGGSRGIGRATVEHLLELDAVPLAVGRDVDALSALRAGCTRISADLTSQAGLQIVLDAAGDGGLHAVVHSAGACQLGTVAETTAEALDLQWQVNLRAPFLLTRALLPLLIEAQGHVVFVNSGAGKRANPGWGAYAATKFGLRALADALRAEVASEGVRVSTVYPGRTATDMQRAVKAHEGKPYEAERLVAPETVAAAIVHALCAPAPAVVDELSVRPLG